MESSIHCATDRRDCRLGFAERGPIFTWDEPIQGLEMSEYLRSSRAAMDGNWLVLDGPIKQTVDGSNLAQQNAPESVQKTEHPQADSDTLPIRILCLGHKIVQDGEYFKDESTGYLVLYRKGECSDPNWNMWQECYRIVRPSSTKEP